MEIKIQSKIWVAVWFLVSLGCTQQSERETLFCLLDPETTGIAFNNRIEEYDTLNILTYEYLYNGGGVGILDVNNDGLKDIFFTGNQVSNALYLNKGNFEFEDISEEAGIGLPGSWCTGVSVVDINSDGLDDIYISVGGPGNKSIYPNRLLINQGNLTFREMAYEFGLADKGESVQAVFFDYDRDNDLDMYLLTAGGFENSAIVPRPILKNSENRNTDRLYQNNYNDSLGHSYFTDVSQEAGITYEGFGLGVGIFDINEDNWPDILVSNDFISCDLLYINNQNGTFTESFQDYFKHTTQFSMGNDIGDINNDGLPDVMSLDMLPDDHYRRKLMFTPNQYDRFYYTVNLGHGYQYMRNMLQVNNGNGTFSEIGQLAGVYKTDWSWAVLMADYDNDQYQDLYITNGYGRDVTDLDFIKFRKDAVGSLPPDKRDRIYLDSLANRPPIVVHNFGFRNNHDLRFTETSKNWGFEKTSISNGAAYADFDQDGDLDLVVNNINQEAFLYKNSLSERSDSAHFLQVQLEGPVWNPAGIGATVELKTAGQLQTKTQYPVRGFQSSVTSMIHFGLANSQSVDTLIVRWSDGRENNIYNSPANKILKVQYQESREAPTDQKEDNSTLMSEKERIVEAKHTENSFNDFNYQPLLIHKHSMLGPGLAVGDVNGDGLADAYMGGAYRESGCFLIQKSDGNFRKRLLNQDNESEDLGSLLFDYDGDKDLDLYVVSGGSEYGQGHPKYQDRLYTNDGKGNFTRDLQALPEMLTSGSCVVASDFDEDGDPDLFVGGRLTPGKYPQIPESHILRNEGGRFQIVNQEVCPEITSVGMVTAALWSDFNGDNLIDLIIAGEAMPISLFENQRGKFVNVTDRYGLKNTDGFWNSLISGDFDNDGDMDYVAGNLGLNTPYHASPSEPITVQYGDFDKNGSVEPYIGYYEEGVNYPVAALDLLIKQVPPIRKHIFYYRDYARTSLETLPTLTGSEDHKTLHIKVLGSSLIRNNGEEGFQLKPLPLPAQIGPIFGMIAEDVDSDGNLDLLAVGNSYGGEVVVGRYDALIGLTLLGDGACNFKNLQVKYSGFFVDGDAKAMAMIQTGSGSPIIMVTQNNDYVKSFTFNNQKQYVSPPSHPVRYAMVQNGDGSMRKVEFPVGGGYLSQFSPGILISSMEPLQVIFYDGKGNVVSRTGN